MQRLGSNPCAHRYGLGFCTSGSLSGHRVRILCAEGKIPADAVKLADRRFRFTESLLDMIDRKKAELDTCRPLTEGEVARLTEEFIVQYTYSSNAIEGNTLTLRETDLVLRGLTIDQKLLKDHMEAVGHNIIRQVLYT